MALLALASAASGVGCAVLSSQAVAMGTETVIIVWDSQRNVQHFIRRSEFESSTPDFGFLVPVPAKPELAEVPAEGFETVFRLNDARERAIQRATAPVQGPSLGCGAPPPDGTAASAVEVLERREVAGFDASVIAGRDAGAMRAWLAENDYPAKPNLEKWLQQYLDQGYPIVALKLSTPSKAGGVVTRDLRISFPTDAPFYPFREPESQASMPGRAWTAFLFAPTALTPALTNGADPKIQMGQRAEAAYLLTDRERVDLLSSLGLPKETLPTRAVLTMNFTNANLRPDADLTWFPGRGAVVRGNLIPLTNESARTLAEPQNHGWVIVLAGAVVGYVVSRLLRRRNRKA